MQTFRVTFNKVDARLEILVDIEDDLLIALAKGKVDHNEITSQFFKEAKVNIRYCS